MKLIQLKRTGEGPSTTGRSRWDGWWRTAEVGKAKGGKIPPLPTWMLITNLWEKDMISSAPTKAKGAEEDRLERLDEARQKARIEEEERIAVRALPFENGNSNKMTMISDTSLTTWNDKDILKLLIIVIIVFCLIFRRLHWTQCSAYASASSKSEFELASRP